MKLENETIEVLKNFASINPSLMVKQGKIQKTVSLVDSVIAKAKLNQEFDRDFAIYDLSNFISALQMFDDAEIALDDNAVTISNRDGANITYRYAQKEVLIQSKYLDKDVRPLNSDIKFRLTKDVLNESLKAVSILAMPEVRIKGDGEHIAIEAVDHKNMNSNLYRKVVADNSAQFEAFFKVDNLKFIPNDYDVTIAPPASAKVNAMAHFSSPLVEYWIAIESHSKF